MDSTGMTDDEKRHDQLTTAPKAVESDADPRIDITESEDGPTRIDWRDDAVVRPGRADDRRADSDSNSNSAKDSSSDS